MSLHPLKFISAIVLGILLISGTAVSVAKANQMAAKFVLSDNMAAAGHGDCIGCPSGDDGGAAGCVPACAVTALALLPAASGNKILQEKERLHYVVVISRGRPFSPEPYPPKS